MTDITMDVDTKALRQRILTMAIQGKLTDQRKEDGNAQDLYNQIQEEKQKLIKEKKIKKEKSLSNITAEEIPFDIPKNWMWVRFGDVANYRKGPFGSSLTKAMFVPKSNNTVKVYEQKNAIRKDASLGNYYIPYDYYEKKMQGFVVHSGDIIVSCAGTIGEAYILPSDIELGILNQALMRVRTYQGIKKEYFLACFGYAITRGDHKGNGTAIKNIPPFSILKKMMFPLPPLAEQKRIVEKVSSLFAQLDAIDKAYDEYRELQQTMKFRLLEQAIQGKLTDQRKEDGNAQDLYNQVLEEKQKLIKEKKIKKAKKLPVITEDEIPFDIPENWMWVRWGTLSISIKYGYNTSAQKDGKIKMVRISDIQNNQVNWDSVPFCNIPKEEITQYLLRKNDILFARTGGTVGKSYLVSEVPENVVYAGYLIRTRYSEKLSPQYLKYFMESDLYWSQLKKGTTTTAQPNCNAKTLGKMVLPLPPLAEQKRIVEKLDKLLPLCEA